MAEPNKVISISTAKKKVMGTIVVDGVEHEVLQLDFGTNQALMHSDGTSAYLGAIRDAIATICPTLSPETIDRLGLDDGQVILLYAGAGVKAVEAMFPNAVSPETQTSAV